MRISTSRDGRLFKFPEWDEYELFDSDDLWSEHAYLLYGEPLAAGQQVVCVCVFVCVCVCVCVRECVCVCV